MLIGKETNTVYISSLLQSDKRFSDSCQRLIKILDKHDITYKFLESTKDIWCRDYMAIQIAKDRFVQFRYEPSYLKDDLDLQSDPEIVYKENKLKFKYEISKINLDGGNVVNWSDKVIITDRIFDENPKYQSKPQLISDLEKRLDAEVIIIPQINSDFTGHADGYVRFVDSSIILGNDREQEYKYWENGMNKVLKEHKLDYIDIPFFEHKDKNYRDSALGCYVNFLEIGNLIILPIFGIKGNKDNEVYDLIKKVYSDRIIETININEVGVFGGLLNCITWTIKELAT